MSHGTPNPIQDFAKFRELLEATFMFPTDYTHKFIGKSSPAFQASVREFEGKFVGLTRIHERTNSNGSFLALTYTFIAGTADDVIELTRATQMIDDLLYIL